MVYDWFNRSSEAPQPPEQPSKSEQAIDPATAQDNSGQTASVEDSTSALQPAPPGAQQSTSDQQAEVSAEDDPLEWARLAYARLKAQKELEKTSQPATPEPSASPEPLAASSEPSESQQSPPPDPKPAEPEPSAKGLSLLEQAAAQRQERQQQLSLIHI